MSEPAYHSVYRARIHAAPEARYAVGDSVAFVHDIMAGPLPIDYRDCDVLYADLPWRDGFAGYNDRAGAVDGRTYRQFLASVSGIVESQSTPVVLVTGRHALSQLPKPAQVVDVTMPVANRQPALALMYGLTAAPEWLGNSPDDLLKRLASMYRCVGDFCCGYGASAYAFLAAGKRFVASDYNAECIGYIAANLGRWMGRA